MGNPKKINLYNSVKRFREGFVEGCVKNGVKLKKMRSRYIVIHLKNGDEAKFIYKNKRFDVDNSYNFFQVRGKEAQVPALIAFYCQSKGFLYNDVVNIQHTANVNKISQMMMLWLQDLPIPETIILSGFSYEANRDYIVENMQFPLVMKKNGDRGKAVWKVDSIEDLDERLFLNEHEKRALILDEFIPTAILQEYIPNTHDFRVTMFEGEVLGVIKRSSTDGFYNNWSRGANWAVSEITDEELDLCQRGCDAVGVDLGGVDIVRTEGGIKFFEINKGPQINVNYPEMIVDRLKDKYLS